MWKMLIVLILLTGCAAVAAPIEPTAADRPAPPDRAALSNRAAPTPEERAVDRVIEIDAALNPHPISPLIYGVSGASPEILQGLRPTLNSWGGNPSTRYNWQIGNAWNSGSDWFYRNGDYGVRGNAFAQFVTDTTAISAAMRVALPTLGWVAKNNNNATCSFPLRNGDCGNANGATCEHPGDIANPLAANVSSTITSTVTWVKQMQGRVPFFAMDNEPELWGYTHYDVHPTCTTYEEILSKYLEYASAVREAAPQAQLLGPVTCCWYFYWNSAAGEGDKAAHNDMDFLPWFLQQVRQYDRRRATRTLDVVDVHFYPEGLYNDKADAETAAHRLRATRSLWDGSYTDESWISQPIALIPRLQQAIDQNYPGLKIGISEWNFGADKTMNGALTIADVLGTYGREGVYLAAYWMYPPLDSPGYFAFKLYSNYDDQGSRFGGNALSTHVKLDDAVRAYTAFDQAAQRLQVMLINTDEQHDLSARLDLKNLPTFTQAAIYRYSAAQPDRLVRQPMAWTDYIDLPASSITLLVAE
jgi:hypothetical protein